jgi:hypothetical protein
VLAEAPPPAAEIVVSHEDGSKLVATRDTPLLLAKARQREDAMLRQAIFLTASLTVVRAADGGSQSYRWSYKGFLQRQLCVTSISGLFACSTAEIESLPDSQSGQAPMSDPAGHPLADAAFQGLGEALKARAEALFASDRAANLDPTLKAAGVKVVKAAPPRAAGPPARRGPAARGGSSG